MMCHLFTHVGIGCTGGLTIRSFFSTSNFGTRIKTWVDTTGHRSLSWLKEQGTGGPSFTFVRNPYDWYIAYYLIQLRYHRWRGSFEDWFYNFRGMGVNFTALYNEMTGPDGCDYTGRFENYEPDLKWIFTQVGVISKVMSEKEFDDSFGRMGWTYNARPWIEGYEQWIRPNMYTPKMLESIQQQDSELMEKFGYSFDDYYYHPGGLEPSSHIGVKEIKWEEEKQLASWAAWAPGPPGVFVKS